MNDIQIPVSASLIKKLFFKGDVRDVCPYRIQQVDILKKYLEQTESILKGSYFETGCIGSGVNNKKTIDLSRKKLSKKQVEENRLAELQGFPPIHSGDKTIDQIRIDEQVRIFQRECRDREIGIDENNVQLTIYKRLDSGILIKGTLDIFPCFMTVNGEKKLFIIDLKLTKDLSSTFGEYAWGEPERMDHVQADMYNELVRDIDFELNPHLRDKISDETVNLVKNRKCFFSYWVFDYHSDNLQNKLIVSTYDENKKKELFEVIRKTDNLVNDYYPQNGWFTAPKYEKCKSCPILDCKDRETIQII